MGTYMYKGVFLIVVVIISMVRVFVMSMVELEGILNYQREANR